MVGLFCQSTRWKLESQCSFFSICVFLVIGEVGHLMSELFVFLFFAPTFCLTCLQLPWPPCWLSDTPTSGSVFALAPPFAWNALVNCHRLSSESWLQWLLTEAHPDSPIQNCSPPASHTFLSLLFLLWFSPGHLSSSPLRWDSHIRCSVCFWPYLTGGWAPLVRGRGCYLFSSLGSWRGGGAQWMLSETPLLILFLFLNGLLLFLLSIWRSFFKY